MPCVRAPIPERRSRGRAVGCAVLAGAVAAVGPLGATARAATAQPRSASPVIYACLEKAHGWMRWVSSPSRCTADEVPLSWVQNGEAGPGAVLTGTVTFVDRTETDGFVGAAGEATLARSAAVVATPLPVAGYVRTLRVTVGQPGAGVLVTVLRNGHPTPLHCVTGASGSCTATVDTPIAYAAGSSIEVEVRHSGAALHDVRWSTALEH